MPDADLEDLDVSVEGTDDDLLVVEVTGTADAVREFQQSARDRVRATSTLRLGVTWGVLPTLKGAYRSAADYWSSFVGEHL